MNYTKAALIGKKPIMLAAIAFLDAIGIKSGRSNDVDKQFDTDTVTGGSMAMFVQFDRMTWLAIAKRDEYEDGLPIYDLDESWSAFVEDISKFQDNVNKIKAKSAIDGEYEPGDIIRCINFGRRKKPANNSGEAYEAGKLYTVAYVETTKIKGIVRIFVGDAEGNFIGSKKFYVHSNWVERATAYDAAKWMTEYIKENVMTEGAVVRKFDSSEHLLVNRIGTDIPRLTVDDMPGMASTTDNYFRHAVMSIDNLPITFDIGKSAYISDIEEIVDAFPLNVAGFTVTFDTDAKVIHIGCVQIRFSDFHTMYGYRSIINEELMESIYDKSQELGIDFRD